MNDEPRRGARPSRPQLVLIDTVSVAAVAFVVVATVELLRDGVGTGNPLDPWRAMGRILSDPTTWRIVALSGALAGTVATLAAVLTRHR